MPAKASERRSIYNQRKKQGYCPRCGKKRRKNSRYIYCDDCRLFFRNYHDSVCERLKEQRRNRYEERKEQGSCPRCGKKLGKRYAKIICPTCLEKQYEYNYGKKRS